MAKGARRRNELGSSDLSGHRGLDRVRRALAGRPLTALVVNAGIALPGPLLHQPVEEIRRVFDVNVFGAVATVQTFAPLMSSAGHPAAGHPARIVAISSVSGKIAAPFVGAYAASKHALEALCDSLRCELIVHGIDVVVVEPGPIATPIWRKSLAGCRERYAATAYAEAIERVIDRLVTVEASALPPARVADVVLEALTVRRPRSRYVVTANRFVDWLLPRALPTRVLDRLIAARLGFKRVDKVRHHSSARNSSTDNPA